MKLTMTQRAFFSEIANIIFSNPFDAERGKLVARMTGKKSLVSAGHEHHFSELAPVLNQQLTLLEGGGITRFQDVSDTADQELISHCFLFQIYHQFADDFDALITQQLALGDEPAPVLFAEDLIGRLMGRGFAVRDAYRYLALFYQFRRAYFFIAKSLIGDSDSMKRLRHALWNNVFTCDVRIYSNHLWDRMEDFSTLLLGETGTGKGSAAAAIGRSGLIPFDAQRRRFRHSFTETFIAINLSQYPETLIESELFGHRKGAFTGAVDHHQGIFERCSSNGALFLDEIGDVSTPVQIKLLNLLQDRQFSPVGSRNKLRFSGRVIAATNRSLTELRTQGTFRDDFFYRLSSDIIQMPTLRDRLAEAPGELRQLVELMVTRTVGTTSSELIGLVMEKLAAHLPAGYAWPGNVRELEQATRRILLKRHYPGDPFQSRTATPDYFKPGIAEAGVKANDLLAAYCSLLYDKYRSYETVARKTGMDRRTVKKYLQISLRIVK